MNYFHNNPLFRFSLPCLTAVLLILTCGCKSKPSLLAGEGFISLPQGKIWYRIVGSGDKTPLVLLHGGPGVPSYYLDPLAEIGTGRPVVFIDQLGCGRSDRITDTSLMTVDEAVEQLETVRAALHIDHFHLYGHSWGTMLGMDYYLRFPGHVSSIIFNSPALSATAWSRDADTLLATLPDSVQQGILLSEQNSDFDNPVYRQGVNLYYQLYLARKLPWSPSIDSALNQMGENVYNYMWGPSEFTATGQLKNYDRTPQLKEIRVPTLFITGEFDEARPVTVRRYQQEVTGATMAVIPGAAHLTMQDRPEENIRVIRDFLASVEKR